MSRKLIFMIVLGAVGSGCGVGGGDDDGQGGAPPDSTDNAQSITCTAQLALTGTFTAAAALDPVGGCQPDGSWAVTATVSDKGTCATVPVKASYTYTLTGVGRDSKVGYTTGTGEEFLGAVSASGDGACTGSFEHIQPDAANFDQLTLRPILPKPAAADTTLTISGTGEFNLWKRHP
jgi:hypothetical protein